TVRECRPGEHTGPGGRFDYEPQEVVDLAKQYHRPAETVFSPERPPERFSCGNNFSEQSDIFCEYGTRMANQRLTKSSGSVQGVRFLPVCGSVQPHTHRPGRHAVLFPRFICPDAAPGGCGGIVPVCQAVPNGGA